MTTFAGACPIPNRNTLRSEDENRGFPISARDVLPCGILRSRPSFGAAAPITARRAALPPKNPTARRNGLSPRFHGDSLLDVQFGRNCRNRRLRSRRRKSKSQDALALAVRLLCHCSRFSSTASRRGHLVVVPLLGCLRQGLWCGKCVNPELCHDFA
jgi:hypothetical protein